MSDKITLTTPKGIAVYPRLDKPDTKFNDNGTYKTDLKISAKDAKPLLDKLTAMYKDWVGKAHPKNPDQSNRNAFYFMALDDQGNETGDIILKLRVTNKITKKGDLWDRRPAQFDAKGTPIAKHKAVSGGSTLKVSFEVYQYQLPTGAKGMSLQPEAVQIIDLIEWNGNKDAGGYGFGQEDGYSDDTAGFSDESDGGGDDDYVPSDESSDGDDY